MQMTHFQNVHVIINPAAGKDEVILNTLNDTFHPNDIRWDVSITLDYGDAERFAREAAQSGDYDLIVAYGGDGTVMEVANGMIGGDVPLAVLPGGTGNALASELGISQQLRPAVELICDETRQLRRIDAGKIGDRYFFLRAGVGLGVSLVEKADRELKNRFGFLAYFFSALEVIQKPERATYRLTIDGEQMEHEGVACMIANSGYMGKFNFKLSSKIVPDDGLLDIVVLNDDLDSTLAMAASIIDLEERAAALPAGWNIIDHEQYQAAMRHWQVKEALIEVDPPQSIRGDGEDFGKTPLQVEVVPGAIDIVTPAKPQKQEEAHPE